MNIRSNSVPLAMLGNMLRIGGESGLWPSRLTNRDVFGKAILRYVITKYEYMITMSTPKVFPTVRLLPVSKAIHRFWPFLSEIDGNKLSAAVEPSNPRMVKANWLGSKLIDLDKNLASVMRLEKHQQGFMETWIGFGQRILSTGP